LDLEQQLQQDTQLINTKTDIGTTESVKKTDRKTTTGTQKLSEQRSHFSKVGGRVNSKKLRRTELNLKSGEKKPNLLESLIWESLRRIERESLARDERARKRAQSRKLLKRLLGQRGESRGKEAEAEVSTSTTRASKQSETYTSSDLVSDKSRMESSLTAVSTLSPLCSLTV
jgi:hypothetical protein